MIASKKVSHYRNCGEIPILYFMKAMVTNETKFLIKDYDNLNELDIYKYEKDFKDEMKETLKELSTEYSGLTFSKKELNRQKELARMMFIEAKCNLIIKVLEIVGETEEMEYLGLLNEIDIKVDLEKDLVSQIKRIKRQLSSLKNRLNIQVSRFKTKYNITDDEFKDEMKSDEKDIESTLDRHALILEKNLETGYKIDIKTTSVIRWENLMKANNEILERDGK